MSRRAVGSFIACTLIVSICLAQAYLGRTCLAQTRPAATTQSAAIDGHWEGTIKSPGMPLAILVDFTRDDAGRLSGKADIPQQGAKDLKLEAIAVDGGHIRFSIRGLPGNPRFDGELRDGRIAGTFSQSIFKVPFDLGRERVALLARPQEPTPPLPYREEEVSYKHDSITTAGTLSIPPGAGPFPAALLISGSGAQDRDEALMGHRPFLVIADRLARAGIVVLRVDDRGVGKSTGEFKDATTEDFAKDAEAGVAYLKTRSEVANNRIGLIGHSEGAVIAPMVASRSNDVAFVIMLAGTGVPGDQCLLVQNERIALAAAMSDKAVAQQTAALRAVMDEVMRGGDEATVRSKVRSLLQIQLAASPLGATTKPSDQEMDELLSDAMKSMSGKWFRFFLSYDPRPALRKLKVPVLVLGGEKDTQVDVDQNLPEIEKALKEAGNNDVTIHRIAGVNHLFQKCKTGSPTEYGQLNETFNEDVLKQMTDWIGQRFGGQGGR